MSSIPVLAALLSAAAGCLLTFFVLRARLATRAVQAEAYLRQSGQALKRLHLLLNTLPDGVIEVNANGLVTGLNIAAQELTGWTKSDAVGIRAEHVMTLRRADVFESTQDLIRNALSSQTAVQYPGAEIRTRSGGTVRIDCAAIPCPTIDGNPGAVLSFRESVQDPAAEIASQRLSAIVEHSDDAIVGMTLKGIVTSWNGGAERTFGFTADEMIGSPVARLIPDWQSDGMLRSLERIAQGETMAQYETTRLTKDGKTITVLLKVSPIRDANGKVVGASKIARDITHQKLLEERLEQTQKMEVVGQLAAGVAHDFNNLLTVINGYANLAGVHIPAEHPAQECLKQIEAAGDRAARMTRQLLAFSRKQYLQPQRLHLNETIEAMQPMFARLVRENIECAFHPDRAIRPIDGDRTQIEQVVLNLVVNASDAMAEGGRIIIETTEALLDEDYARLRADVQPGQYVMIAVTDCGSGIDPVVGAHIFEPFFTTKPPGKGTGLGLSTVYGIVKQSGGHLTFYSEPGIGTTFRVYLPVADGAVMHEQTQPEVSTGSLRGSEVILVVEDDSALLKFTAITLRELGYTVYAALPGDEAIQIGQTLGDSLDLMVTDVVMPGVGGRQLSALLKPFAPRMKVLFMSGYAETGITIQGVIDPNMAFLAKPFRADQLAMRVRQVLESKPVTRQAPQSEQILTYKVTGAGGQSMAAASPS